MAAKQAPGLAPPVPRAQVKATVPGFAAPSLTDAWQAAGGVTAGVVIGGLLIYKLFPANRWITALLTGSAGLILAGSSNIGTWPEELGLGLFAVAGSWALFSATGSAPPPGGATPTGAAGEWTP